MSDERAWSTARLDAHFLNQEEIDEDLGQRVENCEYIGKVSHPHTSPLRSSPLTDATEDSQRTRRVTLGHADSEDEHCRKGEKGSDESKNISLL